jgi:hypothetical protein
MLELEFSGGHVGIRFFEKLLILRDGGTPVTSTAQITAALEAALGTLYLAILIGRIVGQLGSRLRPTDAVPADHPQAGAQSDRFAPP